MKTFFHSLLKSTLNLVYPPFCMHCDASLDNGGSFFCQECLEELVFIDRLERCPSCFSPDIDPELNHSCQRCQEHPFVLKSIGAAFDYHGVAASLIKQMKYGGQSFLAKGAGAYLVAQFVQLDWPMPDYIIPMPMATLRKMERGYNQSLLLAEMVGKLLDRPVIDIVGRRSGEFSQAGLNYEQRLKLSYLSFFIKKECQLHDKIILLIDDVMTTGSSLNSCAETLFSLYPQSVYGLTVCRAV